MAFSGPWLVQRLLTVTACCHLYIDSCLLCHKPWLGHCYGRASRAQPYAILHSNRHALLLRQGRAVKHTSEHTQSNCIDAETTNTVRASCMPANEAEADTIRLPIRVTSQCAAKEVHRYRQAGAPPCNTGTASNSSLTALVRQAGYERVSAAGQGSHHGTMTSAAQEHKLMGAMTR